MAYTGSTRYTHWDCWSTPIIPNDTYSGIPQMSDLVLCGGCVRLSQWEARMLDNFADFPVEMTVMHILNLILMQVY